MRSTSPQVGIKMSVRPDESSGDDLGPILTEHAVYGLASRLSKVWRGYPHNLTDMLNFLGIRRNSREFTEICGNYMRFAEILGNVEKL